MKHLPQIVLLVGLTSIVSGCASTKESLLPQTGPTMEEVYQQQIKRDEAEDARVEQSSDIRPQRGISPSDSLSDTGNLRAYTREANTELQSMFPQLPNPTLVMFVYPHLSSESRLPVPGYSTSFQMYDRTEYALPGEM